MQYPKLKILVFVCPWYLQVGYKRDFLRALQIYSGHDVCFCPDFSDSVSIANRLEKADYDLNAYDVVLIDRSIWLSFGYPSSKLERGLDSYYGVKAVLVNDDYYNTENIRTWIEDRGIDLVVTAVPDIYIDKVYPNQRFVSTQFVSMLPGYVPIDEALENFEVLQLDKRPYDVIYRGRHYSRWMGELVKEKWTIGKEMKMFCKKYNLVEDIKWEESDRIFGNDWYHFLQNGRTTLGTESGANIFDEHGLIKRFFEEHGPRGEDQVDLACIPPELNYREMNLGVKMNQMPPKLFEAIYLKTALVLFEGEYSNILKKDRHYIPLQKDFSNIDEVVTKIKNIDLLVEMTERTYDEVINNQDYWYSTVISSFVGRLENIHKDKITKSSNQIVYLRDSSPTATSLEDILVTGMLTRETANKNLQARLQQYRKANMDSSRKLKRLRVKYKELSNRRDQLRDQLKNKSSQHSNAPRSQRNPIEAPKTRLSIRNIVKKIILRRSK